MAEASRNYPVDSYVHVYSRGVDKRLIFMDDYDRERFLISLFFFALGLERLAVFLDRLVQKENIAHPPFPLVVESIVSQAAGDDPLVQMLCFGLVENHHHLLLKQVTNGGIALFMQRFNNSYTRYFNLRHDRSGSLFEGKYQSVLVDSEEQLLHVSRYIHLQSKDLVPPTSLALRREKTLDFIRKYPWNSYPDYIGGRQEASFSVLTDREPILSYFEVSQWKSLHQQGLGNLTRRANYRDFAENYLDIPKTGIEDLIIENTP